MKIADVVSGTILLRKIYYEQYDPDQGIIVERRAPLHLKFRFNKLLTKFEKAYAEYDQFRIEAIKKYGKKTPLNPENPEDGERYEIEKGSEAEQQFVAELNALLQEDVKEDLLFKKLTEEDIEELEQFDPPIDFNRFELAMFSQIFVENEEESEQD